MPFISIRVIVPKKDLFNYENLVREIDNTLHQKTEPDLRQQFKGTTEGWKKQPAFSSHFIKNSSSMGVQVYTSDSVYGIVNAGSPPHPISARRGKLLRFQRGYRSSTRTGSLQSGSNSRFGDWVMIPRLKRNHPGFPGRKFDEQISEIYGPKFLDDMNEAFKAGLP